MESSNGLMAESIEVDGKMENSMAKDSTLTIMERKRRENG
jgi:hypothetical protein